MLTLPGDLGRIPPALRFTLQPLTLEAFKAAFDQGINWLSREPALATLGHAMLEEREPEMRVQGCVWLTLFPGVESARAMARVALDHAQPKAVRDQAAWTLGYRQQRGMPDEARWSEEALAIADGALAQLVDEANAAGKVELSQLAPALRHVQAPAVLNLMAKAPLLWGEGYEAFATKELARVLLDRLAELPDAHWLRAVRLCAATLGAECVSAFLARAPALALGERLELLLLCVALEGDRHLPTLEQTLSGLRTVEVLKARAAQRRVPLVSALALARSTGCMGKDERLRAAEQSADEFAAFAKFGRFPEAYCYTLWSWMVRHTDDPVRARALATAHPDSTKRVWKLFMRDLAERGRIRELMTTAQAHRAADYGALLLAIHGRPFASMQLSTTAAAHSAELVAARALAAYRVGRPDLSAQVATSDLPRAAIVEHGSIPAFPGPHEQWLAEHAPLVRPAVTALVRRDLLSLARPAPEHAEPDPIDFRVISQISKRRQLAGASVFLVGQFTDRRALESKIERAGAHLVHGPFPGTHFYVLGAESPLSVVAQLDRQGARELMESDL